MKRISYPLTPVLVSLSAAFIQFYLVYSHVSLSTSILLLLLGLFRLLCLLITLGNSKVTDGQI